MVTTPSPSSRSRRSRAARLASWGALVCLILGAIDPLEGSVVIALGTVVAAVTGWMARSQQRRLLVTAAALTIVGVGVLFGLSALGGIGGDTGRSTWWALLLLPYPVGWVVALVGTLKLLAECRRPDAPSEPA